MPLRVHRSPSLQTTFLQRSMFLHLPRKHSLFSGHVTFLHFSSTNIGVTTISGTVGAEAVKSKQFMCAKQIRLQTINAECLNISTYRTIIYNFSIRKSINCELEHITFGIYQFAAPLKRRALL